MIHSCFTEGCRGVITYSPEGFFSAQLQEPRQHPIVSNISPEQLSPEQWQGGGRDDFIYSGRYSIEKDGERLILVHYIQICSYMNWLGVIHRRTSMEFSSEEGGSFLVLKGKATVSDNDVMSVDSIKWEKIEACGLLPDKVRGLSSG